MTAVVDREILEGSKCQRCFHQFEKATGYPRFCPQCLEEEKRKRNRRKKIKVEGEEWWSN